VINQKSKKGRKQKTGNIRHCNSKCHSAKGSLCRCWCGGSFHGIAGAANREALLQSVTEADRVLLLEQHGFKHGETVYMEQTKFPEEISQTEKEKMWKERNATR